MHPILSREAYHVYLSPDAYPLSVECILSSHQRPIIFRRERAEESGALEENKKNWRQGGKCAHLVFASVNKGGYRTWNKGLNEAQYLKGDQVGGKSPKKSIACAK